MATVSDYLTPAEIGDYLQKGYNGQQLAGLVQQSIKTQQSNSQLPSAYQGSGFGAKLLRGMAEGGFATGGLVQSGFRNIGATGIASKLGEEIQARQKPLDQATYDINRLEALRSSPSSYQGQIEQEQNPTVLGSVKQNLRNLSPSSLGTAIGSVANPYNAAAVALPETLVSRMGGGMLAKTVAGATSSSASNVVASSLQQAVEGRNKGDSWNTVANNIVNTAPESAIYGAMLGTVGGAGISALSKYREAKVNTNEFTPDNTNLSDPAQTAVPNDVRANEDMKVNEIQRQADLARQQQEANLNKDNSVSENHIDTSKLMEDKAKQLETVKQAKEAGWATDEDVAKAQGELDSVKPLEPIKQDPVSNEVNPELKPMVDTIGKMKEAGLSSKEIESYFKDNEGTTHPLFKQALDEHSNLQKYETSLQKQEPTKEVLPAKQKTISDIHNELSNHPEYDNAIQQAIEGTPKSNTPSMFDKINDIKTDNHGDVATSEDAYNQAIVDAQKKSNTQTYKPTLTKTNALKIQQGKPTAEGIQQLQHDLDTRTSANTPYADNQLQELKDNADAKKAFANTNEERISAMKEKAMLNGIDPSSAKGQEYISKSYHEISKIAEISGDFELATSLHKSIDSAMESKIIPEKGGCK